jgi:hypothetical protein
MVNRKDDVDALAKRSEKDFALVRSAYEKCLHDQTISSDLKIDIKNLCGNLRSTLDYIAHDIRGKYCHSANPNARFYFPIISNASQYQIQMNNWFPGLYSACPDLWSYLESIQPYNSEHAWLGMFNRINNENKHESLVEQTRTETKRINVSFGGGSVDWDPNAVKFGPGVFIGCVPVNPRTQMPIPHPSQKVEQITWVDFKFDGINESALSLLQKSVKGISEIVLNTYRWL